MIIALILPHVKDGEERGKSKLFLLLCVAIFFLNGSISIISYVHSNSEIATDNNSFLFLLYLFIGVLSAIVYAVYCIKNKDNMFINKPEFSKRQHILFWFYIVASTLASAVSYLLQLVSAGNLPAVTTYPMVTGGTVVLMGLAGWLIFKEKLNAKNIISIVSTFVATVLFIF